MKNNEYITKDINPEQLLNILNEYYSIKERRDIIFNYDLKVIYNDTNLGINIQFYTEMFIKGDKVKVPLKDEDIFEPLNNIANNNHLDLIELNYLGHVRKVGYYTDEDTPIFEGVRLIMKKKNKIKKKIKD